MPRYVAFLRALNTGKNRTITMAAIRQVFASLGFAGAVTAFTSGNVVFETGEPDSKALERVIEAGLVNALGLAIATFLRTDAELAAVAAYRSFPQPEIEAAVEYNIIFLADAPGNETSQKIMALSDDENEFRIHGREVYWLRHIRLGQANFSSVPLAKAIPGAFTIRTANIVRKISQKYCNH